MLNQILRDGIQGNNNISLSKFGAAGTNLPTHETQSTYVGNNQLKRCNSSSNGLFINNN